MGRRCSRGGAPTPPPTGERDSFYCGADFADADDKCLVPCPGGSSMECPDGESCIPFTSCRLVSDEPDPVAETFYCGTTKEEAEATCTDPCPRGAEQCPDGQRCFSFTSCGPTTDSAVPAAAPQDADPGSFYCGTDFENATLTCADACPTGSSGECPVGQSCYGFTSCSDRDSFYCGTAWDEASSTCATPCPSGSNGECPNGEVCFGYTSCNAVDNDIPVESFYCGATFEEASTFCTDPCPSSLHSDCPDGQLCHPYTPCGERDSFYCGTSWSDAATSCLIPCPR